MIAVASDAPRAASLVPLARIGRDDKASRMVILETRGVSGSSAFPTVDLDVRYRRLWRPGVVLVPDTSSERFASNSAVRMPNGQIAARRDEICAAHALSLAYLAGLRREQQCWGVPASRLESHDSREPWPTGSRSSSEHVWPAAWAMSQDRCAVTNLWKEEGLRNPDR